MAKFLLHYTSGVKSEIVEAADGIEAYIKERFGHINEYLKIGGAPPKLIEPVVEPIPEPVAAPIPEPVAEVVHVDEPSSGSAEQTETNAQ